MRTGAFGTFATVLNAIECGMQVVLVRDSGGAAEFISELVEPLLERAKDLPLEGFVREKAIKRRLERLTQDAPGAKRAQQKTILSLLQSWLFGNPSESSTGPGRGRWKPS